MFQVHFKNLRTGAVGFNANGFDEATGNAWVNYLNEIWHGLHTHWLVKVSE